MASVEHCLYCFEVLAAHLEDRSPMTLYQVIQSWEQYPKGLDEDDEKAPLNSKDNTPTSNPGPAIASPIAQRPSFQTRHTSTTATTTTTRSRSNSARLTAPRGSTPSATDGSGTPERSFTPVGIGRKTSQRTTTITESPLFVTWNKAIAANPEVYSLRGCIGTFSAEPLATGLSSYALTSSLHDTRFSPVTASELPHLEVAVTLLTDFEPCADPMDWELGVHGLRISFYYRNRRLSATYLPDVAVEQGWSMEETLVSLMRKAGWTGSKARWKEVGDLKVVRYQGKKESVEWEEYRAWRAWVERGKGT